MNFYATPGDIAQLEAEIRQLEPLAIVHSRSQTVEPRTVPSLDFKQSGQRWLFYYLVRESDWSAVATRHVPAQGYWTVDVLRSPVVEFNSCHFDGKILRRGRVYYVDGFYSEDQVWVDKPQSFRHWARAVLKTTKKLLKRHGSDYIGHEASIWLEREGGELLQ